MTRAIRHHECRGFTLMELMVVMGIMVLILGMGVLVYNTLTGNRSISMAQNQVAGMLARARAMAPWKVARRSTVARQLASDE